jgi:twitching motility protein PilI
MAANGFIELLRLAKRGNKNYVSNENEVPLVGHCF